MDPNENFTFEAVRQFMLAKGGLCTNHDLVAHFKPLLNHTVRKLENRNKLKEFVQLLASVETREGEKVLVLKKRYQEHGCVNLFPNQVSSEPAKQVQDPSNINIPEAFNTPPPVEQEPQPVAPQRSTRSNGYNHGTSSDPTSDGSEFGFYSAGAFKRSVAQDIPDVTPPAPQQANVAPWERHQARSTPPPVIIDPPVIEETPAQAPAILSQSGVRDLAYQSRENGRDTGSYRSSADGQSDTASISSNQAYEPLPQPDMGFYSNLVNTRVQPNSTPEKRPASPPPPPPTVSSINVAPMDTADMAGTNETDTSQVVMRNSQQPRTPGEVFNSDTIKKTPMSAKERIKQFDQISSEQATEVGKMPQTRQNNRQSRHHSTSNQAGNTQSIYGKHNVEPDYDGEITMVSLDAMEKDWMIKSSGSDYHAMCVLLRDRPDLAHRRDFINGNAMHWAAKHGKPEVIKMLHGYQVDPNLKSHCGYTPLHLAAMAGNEECIDILVNLCKVKPNTRDFYGKRPKQYLNRNCSTRIQQMLLTNARQSFTVGNTVDDTNSFARTQSFSAKIMKTTQGLARKFSTANRSSSSSDNIRDIRDPISESPNSSPGSYRRNHLDPNDRNSSVPPRFGTSQENMGPPSQKYPENSRHSATLEMYAMSRSESAPEIPPFKAERQAPPVFTNIREF